ncbi:MAG: ABC transporter permease [Bryobacteraceae bacterium]|nr:ABC transporter permease [Bryobacteraceae bacterium]
MIHDLWEDLRYGSRVLRGAPAATAVAVATLSLGIAANTTVFGWIYSLFVEPVPGVTRPGELVTLETVTPAGEYTVTSYRDFRDYRDHLTLSAGVGAALMNPFNIDGGDGPQRVWGELVSGNYFDVLGVKPALGRTFALDEQSDAPGSAPVVVLGHGVWKRLFAGDPRIVGKTLLLNGRRFTVVGVAPAEFRGTVPGVVLELWTPMAMGPELNGQNRNLLEGRDERQMWVTARLRQGVTLEQLRTQAEGLARRIAEGGPASNRGFGVAVMALSEGHWGVHALLGRPLQLLAAVCGLVFLIVVSNVANLQLARAAGRQREFSTRLALGAGRWRLARQLLAESALLSAMAAVGGILLSMWMGQSLAWLLPPVLEAKIIPDFPVRAPIVGFVAGLCVIAVFLTGLAPAAHLLRRNAWDQLKDNGRTVSASAAMRRTRSLLVVLEVGLALVALVGTVLFARSFQNGLRIDPGLDAQHLLVTQVRLSTFCHTPEDRIRFCARLKERLRLLPGVQAASFGDHVPLTFGMPPSTRVEVEGYAPHPKEDMRVFESIVGPGYLESLAIPLLEGREFRETDDAKAERVTIVNEAFARKYFRGENPVGRKVRFWGRWNTVVGLAKNSKHRTLSDQDMPFFYVPQRQTRPDSFWVAFFVRTRQLARDAEGVRAAIRREAAAVEPQAGAIDVIPFEESIAGLLYPQKIAATLVGGLGVLSVVLAVTGLYSLLAYAVTQRRQELGIRVALGAGPADILKLVLSEGMRLTLLGLAAGTALAISAAPLAQDLLLGVKAHEPAHFLLSGAVLLGVAILACLIPGWTALRVQPAIALRRE